MERCASVKRPNLNENGFQYLRWLAVEQKAKINEIQEQKER
jgi:hypothetical protein